MVKRVLHIIVLTSWVGMCTGFPYVSYEVAFVPSEKWGEQGCWQIARYEDKEEVVYTGNCKEGLASVTWVKATGKLRGRGLDQIFPGWSLELRFC